MLTETLGNWQIAANTCTVTLTVDRPRRQHLARMEPRAGSGRE
jgi:hypothetical protein